MKDCSSASISKFLLYIVVALFEERSIQNCTKILAVKSYDCNLSCSRKRNLSTFPKDNNYEIFNNHYTQLNAKACNW